MLLVKTFSTKSRRRLKREETRACSNASSWPMLGEDFLCSTSGQAASAAVRHGKQASKWSAELVRRSTRKTLAACAYISYWIFSDVGHRALAQGLQAYCEEVGDRFVEEYLALDLCKSVSQKTSERNAQFRDLAHGFCLRLVVESI